MDESKQSVLPVGEIVQFIRKNLFFDETGERLGQADFYHRCRKLESTGHHANRKRRFGNVADDSYARKKIRRLEKSNISDVTTHELSIVATAFGLPSNFFLSEYTSLGAVSDAYTALTAQSVELDGFPRIYSTDPIPRSRYRLAQLVARRIGVDRKNRFVFVIEGPTSVGKSFFVGYLYSTVLKDRFEKLRYLNCSKLSIDQIVPQLRQLSFDFREPLKGKVPPNSNKHDLVVLDGLRLDQFREGPQIAGVTAGRRRPSISDLMGVVAQIQRRTNPTDVLIILENNGEPVGDHRFAEPLATGVKFRREFIQSLSTDEAIDFLRRSGATTISDRLAAQIAEYFYGMPMALVTVAEEIRNLGAIQTERYVDDLRKGSESEDNAVTRSGKFIEQYLHRLGENIVSSQKDDPTFVHPHAFLRLLSLMPGPISKAHLIDIVRELAIKRIGRFSDLHAAARALPFVVETDDTYDLHGLVRGFLAAEIEQYIRQGNFDVFIVREELEKIHWRSALLSWRMIKTATKADDITIEAINSFVHHITKLISLLPPERLKRKLKTITEDVIHNFESRYDSLTDSQLWSIAYEKAAKPFLLDSTFHATRLHGQFHAKARILESLIQAVEDGIRLPDILSVELCKETSLCWLHTGRLLSAEEFLYKSVRILRRLEPNFPLFLKDIQPGVKGKIAERWRLLCDAISIEAIIKTRLGRQNDDIRAIIEPFAVVAINISKDTVYQGESDKEFSPALESGAIRMISRLAELELSAGNLDLALEYFGRANDLQKSVRNRILDGEAARKYTVALLRSKHLDGNFDLSCNLVAENLDRMKHFEQIRGKISNDVIPFLVLEVAIHRCAGRLEEAQRLFRSLIRHRYVQNAECTFVAMLEIELERFRLAIAAGDSKLASAGQIQKFVAECERSHHFLLANEFRLLQAEVCPSDARARLTRECRRNFHTTGHRLRIVDCDLLDQGQSSVRLIGV